MVSVSIALPIEQKVTVLLGAVSNVAEIPEEGRSLAAVMLRRLFSSEFEDFFSKVSGNLSAQPSPGSVDDFVMPAFLAT